MAGDDLVSQRSRRVGESDSSSPEVASQTAWLAAKNPDRNRDIQRDSGRLRGSKHGGSFPQNEGTPVIREVPHPASERVARKIEHPVFTDLVFASGKSLRLSKFLASYVEPED